MSDHVEADEVDERLIADGECEDLIENEQQQDENLPEEQVQDQHSFVHRVNSANRLNSVPVRKSQRKKKGRKNAGVNDRCEMFDYTNNLMSQLTRNKTRDLAKIFENLSSGSDFKYLEIINLILNSAKVYVPLTQELSFYQLRNKISRFINKINNGKESDDSDETDWEDEDTSLHTYKASIDQKQFRQKYEFFFENLISYFGTSILDDANQTLITFLSQMSKLKDGMLFDATTIAGLKMMSGLVNKYSEPCDVRDEEDENHVDFVNVKKYFEIFFENFFKPRHDLVNAKVLVLLSNEMIDWLELKPILVLNETCFAVILHWIKIAYSCKDSRDSAVSWKKFNENSTTILERIRMLAINMHEADRDYSKAIMIPLCEQFLQSKFIFDKQMVVLRVDTLNFGLMIFERFLQVAEFDDLVENLKAVILSLNDEDRELARASAKLLCVTLWPLKPVDEHADYSTGEQIKAHLLELLNLIVTEPHWRDYQPSAFVVDALMFVHPMVTEWKLLLDVCFGTESSTLQSNVAFDILRWSIFYLIDPNQCSPSETLEVTDAMRLEKTELFNQIFLNDYMKLLQKYSFQDDFLHSILKMASFFGSEFIDINDRNKMLIMNIVHECIKIFNETDKYCSEIIQTYQKTVVDEPITAEKILSEAIKVLMTFKDKFPFCKEIIVNFFRDLHINYIAEFGKWTQNDQSSPETITNYTNILIRVSYVQTLTDFKDLTWHVIHDEFFNCKKFIFDYAYIASMKMCQDFIVKYGKKIPSLTPDSIDVFAQNKNNYLVTLYEYFGKSTVNLTIRKECFFQLQQMYLLFDRNSIRKLSKQQSVIEQLDIKIDKRIYDLIVRFLKEYVCDRNVEVKVNPDRVYEQVECLKAVQFMIETKKFPKNPFIPIFRKLLQANEVLKSKAEQVLA